MEKYKISNLSPDEFLDWVDNNNELIPYCTFKDIWHVEDRYRITIHDRIVNDDVVLDDILNKIKLGKYFGVHYGVYYNILSDILTDEIKNMTTSYCFHSSDVFFILDGSIYTKNQKKYFQKVAQRMLKDLKFYSKLVEIDDDEEEKQYGYDYRLYFHTDEKAFEKLNS